MKKFLCLFLTAVITLLCMAAISYCSMKYEKNRVLMNQELTVGDDFIECVIDGELHLYYK